MTEDQIRRAASKLGVTAEFYGRQHAAGKAFCTYHAAWHPRTMFAASPDSLNGLVSKCRRGRRLSGTNPYVGRDPAQARRFKPWGGRRLSLVDDE